MTERLDSNSDAVEINRCITRDRIRQLVAGDHVAFRAIYDAYNSKVYRLAYKYLKDKALSQDIVQETFIRLWTVKQNVQDDKDIWCYLSVITKRLALNSLRNISKSEVLTSKLFYHIEDANNSTEDKLYVRDLEEVTEKLIKALPQQQQKIYKLSRKEGLSHKEIAEQLHISPSTVNNHLVQALKTLKSNLDYSYFVHLMLIYFVFYS